MNHYRVLTDDYEEEIVQVSISDGQLFPREGEHIYIRDFGYYYVTCIKHRLSKKEDGQCIVSSVDVLVCIAD